jgi:hypothetical protein
MCLLAAGAAVQKHMEKLGNEQEIVGLIADMLIEIFAMESTYLRTLKRVQKVGGEKSKIQIVVARVYINDSFPKVELIARQIFAAVSEGDELRTQLMGLKKLGRYTPINTIALRREVADSVIPVARYNLTKM